MLKFPKLSMAPIYSFFAATDGFGELIVLLCLTAAILLAWFGKLTDAYAAVVGSITGIGVIHDGIGNYIVNKWNRNKNE